MRFVLEYKIIVFLAVWCLLFWLYSRVPVKRWWAKRFTAALIFPLFPIGYPLLLGWLAEFYPKGRDCRCHAAAHRCRAG